MDFSVLCIALLAVLLNLAAAGYLYMTKYMDKTPTEDDVMVKANLERLMFYPHITTW